MVGTPQHEYTAAELVADATAAGTPASARLLTDWVGKGLLDRPHVRGLGRGRGTIATWPESQRRLLLALLAQRRQGVKRLATLCNVPVALWLDSEGLDVEHVPLRQARRCLATWGTAHQTASGRSARYSAGRLIEQQGAPDISRRAQRALVDAVERSTGGGALDRDALLDAAMRAFDSRRVATVWVRTIEARLAALGRLDAFDEETFHAARSMVNQTASIYLNRQLDSAASGQARRERAVELATELANDVCIGLLSALGFLELARRQGQTHPDNSPPRPLHRPGGMAHGKDPSACARKIPPSPEAASSSRTATG